MSRHPLDGFFLRLGLPLTIVLFCAVSGLTAASANPSKTGVIPASERFDPNSQAPVQYPRWPATTESSLPAPGQDPDDEAWWPAFGPQRVGNTVLAATVFDGNLVIGGDFVDASGQTAFHVARWSESSWQPIGSGFNESVLDLAVIEDRLVAAGAFTLAGTDTVSYVAEWDGVTWRPLGDGFDDTALSLAVIDGQLYAGGYFQGSSNSGNDVELNGIAEWDGSAWNPLGSGVGGSRAHVSVIEDWNGDLLIGGTFTEADGQVIENLARWDGSTWVEIAGGVDNWVYDIAVSGSDLIVGGGFSRAGAVEARAIARFDGTDWSAIDGGMNSSVLSILVADNMIYAGGLFSTAGDTTAISVARLDEAGEWTSLGTDMDGGVTRLLQWDGRVIAVGIFINAGGETVNFVAQWDGNGWGPVGSEVNGSVEAILADAPCADCELVMAGNFTSAGGLQVNRVAAWSRRDPQDPESWGWRALGAGFNGSIHSLTEFDGELYAGGAFTFVDTLPGGGLARWDGDDWLPVGEGIEGEVNDATIWNDRLIVAGDLEFIEGNPIASQVTAWDGSEFQPVGTTLSGNVNAVEVYHDSLFIGGTFLSSSGTPISRIGKNIGGSWGPVRSGVNDEVRDLEVYDDRLYVGGLFSEVDGSSIASLTTWNGSEFSADVDTISGTVETLHAGIDFLYVGGDFFLETATGPTSSLALHTSRGGWFRLGNGLDDVVLAVDEFEEDVYVGGEFAIAGARPSPGIARYLGGIPVPVQLSQFFGRRSGANVEVHWKVDSSRDHAGFHLYRGDTSPNARITPNLIRTASPDGSYRFDDRDAPIGATIYWLEEVSLDGTATLFGPIEVSAAEPGPLNVVDHFSSGPNPFSEQVELRFRLAQAGFISGTIHDVQGRQVAEFPSEELTAGLHTLIWDGSTLRGADAVPGVYFASVRFDAKDLTLSRRPWMHTARLLKLR